MKDLIKGQLYIFRYNNRMATGEFTGKYVEECPILKYNSTYYKINSNLIGEKYDMQ